MKVLTIAILTFTLCSLFISPSSGAGASSSANSYAKSETGEFVSWSDRVYYDPDRITVVEGGTLRITCQLNVFDLLKWMHNGTQLLIGINGISAFEVHEPHGFVTNSLTIQNAQTENSGEYKCTTFSPKFVSVSIMRAHEVEGNSCQYGSTSSKQPCLAYFLSTSSDKDSLKNLREGFPLILECKIQKKGKDDALKVLWFKDNKQIMPDDHPDQEHFKILENSNLTIAKANSTRDIGLYRCQALDNPDAKPFEINVFHLVFKKLPKSITVLQGDKLSISCDVGGTSKPTVAWSWKKESGNVDEAGVNGSRHHFIENDNHVPNATFVINEAQYDDRGYYTCFIQMEGINISNSTTYVRVKDMYAALWPFLGICVEVIILCLIIFIYEKRRAKADFEESDTDQPPEQKNKQDENKDVRQRK